MRRLFLYFTLVFLLMVGCQSSPQESDSNDANSGSYKGVIKVGHLVALDMAPLFIAKEKGFFTEEGLDVETVFFSNPGDNNAALAGGSIQFSTNPFTLPYFGENGGVPMRIISSAGGIGVIEVVIQGGLGISNVEELVEYIRNNPDKKLKIAVLKGDTLEMIIQKVLNDNDLDYDNVEMVWFNDLLAMVQAFQTNQVDLLSHIKPYTTNMIVNHNAKALVNNDEVWGHGTPNCTVAVLQSFSDSYPTTVKKYLKALKKGFQFIVDSPEEASELLDKGNYYKVDIEVLKYAFKNQPKEVLLAPNKEGMMQAINAMVEMGYIKKPEKDIIIASFLE